MHDHPPPASVGGGEGTLGRQGASTRQAIRPRHSPALSPHSGHPTSPLGRPSLPPWVPFSFPWLIFCALPYQHYTRHKRPTQRTPLFDPHPHPTDNHGVARRHVGRADARPGGTEDQGLVERRHRYATCCKDGGHGQGLVGLGGTGGTYARGRGHGRQPRTPRGGARGAARPIKPPRPAHAKQPGAEDSGHGRNVSPPFPPTPHHPQAGSFI